MPRTGAQNRGVARERDLRRLLQQDGWPFAYPLAGPQKLFRPWFVVRASGSLGDADLLALRNDSRPLLIEVKATQAGPYAGFGPSDRGELWAASVLAGAEAWLCWWPKRQHPTWIHESRWPA